MNPTNESIGRRIDAIITDAINTHCPGGKWVTGPATLHLAISCDMEDLVRELDRQAPGNVAKWPSHVMLRDTNLHDDQGGLGQRIFTTAGAGYEKVKYVRADLIPAPQPPAQEQGEVGEHVLMLDMILTSYGDKPLTFTAEKAALKAAITALTRAAGAEDARNRKDAERYRWMRSDYDPSVHGDDVLWLSDDAFDREIDFLRTAAIASQAQEGGRE